MFRDHIYNTYIQQKLMCSEIICTCLCNNHVPHICIKLKQNGALHIISNEDLDPCYLYLFMAHMSIPKHVTIH